MRFLCSPAPSHGAILRTCPENVTSRAEQGRRGLVVLRQYAMSRTSFAENILDLDKIVAELKSERRRLDLAIAALEVLRSGRSRGRGLLDGHVVFKSPSEGRRQRHGKPRPRMEAHAQRAVGDMPVPTARPRRGTVVVFPSNQAR